MTDEVHDHSKWEKQKTNYVIREPARNLKPSAILDMLEKQKIECPSKKKLNNFLANYRRNEHGNKCITMNELVEYVTPRSRIPEDLDQPFIAAYEYDASSIEKRWFRLFITTKRLVKLVPKTKHVMADATYKLVYEGFPSLTIGTTDHNKNFHHFGIAVTTNERTEDFEFLFKSIKKVVEEIVMISLEPDTLIADNALEITNGFSSVFNLKKRINCWAHALRLMDGELKHVEKKTRDEIRKEIKSIQALSTKIQLEKTITLFQAKYKEHSDAKKNWCCDGKKGWYEGYYIGKLSTSNALESKHRSIKDFGYNRLRKRLPLKQCLDEMFNLVEKWSKRYNPVTQVLDGNNETIQVPNENFEIFYSKPIITTKDWTDAYQWQRLDKRVIKIGSNYFVPERFSIDDNEVKTYATDNFDNFTDFDEFIQNINSINVIQVNRD
ncbi:hypothetical protein BpHYR1_026778 [Brachionus plicatilis]|uniref:MULE transposase domain-containing protein n=1 Tax=Brachionus plicatilis TaxID=10195 RepID=A0A3M7QAT9_BRAPC|nr:hypothetical protein BpHYR1_026778 [Brachionus plicatilis]